MFVVCLMIAVLTPAMKGNNLLLNKPSLQSISTESEYSASRANDGNLVTYSATKSTVSYWQGDLQDVFPVKSVVVSLVLTEGESIQETFIGVSNADRSTNPMAEFIQCGQWPDGVEGTAVFTCDSPHPVRYVLVERTMQGYLYVAEVEVPDTTTQSLAELNLMLNKSSTQSSTLYGYAEHAAGRANDGDLLTVSLTDTDLNPYWQGDLQGDFLIQSIAVTMSAEAGFNYHRNAYIGISGQDINTIDNSDLVVCGQWPDQIRGVTLLFRCEHSRGVRFVMIWREGVNYLAVAEVAVQGTYAGRISEMTMSSMDSKKVSTATKTLHTGTSTECANECFRKQPCFAFSFNKMAGQERNCLLSADTTVMSDANWVSYKMEATSYCP